MNSSGNLHRNWILLGLILNSFTLGCMYSWSVFAQPLADYTGWQYSDVSVAYTVLLCFNASMAIPSGKLADKGHIRIVMFLGSIVFGGAWALTGNSTSLFMLYLIFGVGCGIGSGIKFNAISALATRWFPDKKGFAGGICTSATGIAPLLIAPFSNAVYERYGVVNGFRVTGLLVLAIGVIGSAFVRKTPENYCPEGYIAPPPATSGGKDYSLREALRDKRFWILGVAFTGVCASGLMIIGHCSNIGKELADLDSAGAALMVGIMSVANFGGRLVMGSLSDKIGRYRVVFICCAINIADMIFLSFAHGFAGFCIGLILAGWAFGGVFAVFASIVSEVFGMKHLGIIFGTLYVSYGVASIIGPMIASRIRDTYGSYNGAFLFAGVLAFIALFCFAAVKRMNQTIHRNINPSIE